MNSPRERILDTAAILFHQQGYNSTGINQIISEAKVAKASFYQHFKSKDDLCAAFLNTRHYYWFGELQKFVSKSSEPKQKILSTFDFLIAMNEKENFRGCSFLNLLSEIPTDKTAILQIIQKHKQNLRDFFRTQLDDKIKADHIYLLFESSIIESQLFRSNELIRTSQNIIDNLI
ncbi:TetR/AcrR family transcriptional regulator [Elizabethkingia anophelis]|uniref:TetR/AcrR family transcriptional regulator n=1 Tax=Elizabethkingia anophelis TaxID=1117645 RepID=UPI001368F0DF|nr:TetR/AcrR family transcriptional regulator [Elizabethkingia anophelis]MYY26511.1 TetR/AcrR family transcriptional regulator [Elizabethkingia anophelis]